MPTYEAKSYLTKGGKIVPPGEQIELAEEQAKRLGEKVSFTESAKLEDKKVDELKTIAEQKGVEGFYTMKKDELVKAISEAK